MERPKADHYGGVQGAETPPATNKNVLKYVQTLPGQSNMFKHLHQGSMITALPHDVRLRDNLDALDGAPVHNFDAVLAVRVGWAGDIIFA